MSEGATRRRALKLAAAIPAAVPAIVSAAGAEPVAFGLIGAGAWGQALLSHSARRASARCVAVCDTDGARLGKFAQGVQRVTDYRRMLERKDVQAVLVATPTYTHFPILRDALAADKHVYCEPPLAFKAEEVHALRDLAGTRAEQVIQVGFQRRYSKFYQTARRMAAKGFLGEVTNIQAQWHRASGLMPAGRPAEANWRHFRRFSGGLTDELGSHQFDAANWIFNDTPEFVTGVGGVDWKRDGRDTYDNISLIFRYPEGRQMTWSAISTNRHLPFFGGLRSEAGEVIVGTEGAIEITLGDGGQGPFGLWFYEPTAARVSSAASAQEIAAVAGATVASRPGGGLRGIPILLERDQITGDESYLEREMKYARRWLYSKGILLPEEDRHPVEAALDGFFECCREGRRPNADLGAGLDSSVAVILANLALDQGRRVAFGEMDHLGRTDGRRKRPIG